MQKFGLIWIIVGAICTGSISILSGISYAQNPIETINNDGINICIVDRNTYQIYIGYKLAYHQAIATGDTSLAHNITQSIQNIFEQECSLISEPINISTDHVDIMCNETIQRLVLLHELYTQQGNNTGATQTMYLIQNIFSAQNCDIIGLSYRDQLISQLYQELNTKYTTGEKQVIPRDINVCFNTYSPWIQFSGNIQSIHVYTLIERLIRTLGNIYTSIVNNNIQNKNIDTLFKSLNTILSRRADTVENNSYPDFHLPLQVEQTVGLIQDMLTSQGLNAIMGFLFTEVGNTGSIINQKRAKLVNNTYRSGKNIQDIEQLLRSQAVTFTRDQNIQNFIIQTNSGNELLKVIVPQRTSGEDQMVISIHDLTTDSYTQEQNSAVTETFVVKKAKIQRLIGNKQIGGLDRSAEYSTQGKLQTGKLVIYAEPYIVVSDLEKTTNINDTVQEDSVQHTITIFGPKACNAQLQREKILHEDTQANNTGRQDIFSRSINNTQVNLHFDDVVTMLADIQNYRQTVPNATSSPQTENYILQGTISHKGLSTATLYPHKDTRYIGFVGPREPVDFMNTYRNDANGSGVVHINTLLRLIQSFKTLKQSMQLYMFSSDNHNNQQDDNRNDEQDDEDESDNLLISCLSRETNTNIPGYYYYPAINRMIYTYCPERIQNCDEYDEIIQGNVVYYGTIGPDTQQCANLDQRDTDNDQTDVVEELF